MGIRKRNSATVRKETRKNIYLAKLMNCSSSPRKMRLIADIVRGKSVEQSLHILKTSSKDAAPKVYKLLLSAIANWQSKNEGVRMEDSNLYVKEIFVDQGRTLKRIKPAPKGMAHRIRKRSNHVTLIIDSRNASIIENETVEENESK